MQHVATVNNTLVYSMWPSAIMLQQHNDMHMWPSAVMLQLYTGMHMWPSAVMLQHNDMQYEA